MDYKGKKCDIIAVDFDGTLCENMWPEIGEPNQPVIDYIKRRKSEGAKIILWTCRVGKDLQNAIIWSKWQGIEYDAVNENVPEVLEAFEHHGRKIYADEYIDDRAVPVLFFNKDVMDAIRFAIT